MVMVHERQTQIRIYQKDLNGQQFSSTVNHENKKAESSNSAFYETPARSERSEQVDCNVYTHSLPQAPNLHKHKESYVSERFIKFIPSEYSSWLLSTYPNAFLVLTVIAERARRVNGMPDGLLIGDAVIGRQEIGECCGLSEKQARLAIQKLIEFNILKIVWNGKKTKNIENRAIKRAIKGMLVNLCDSSIWDINPEDEGHQKGQRRANRGPTEGHKQERKRMNKNEKETIDMAVAPDRSSLFQNEKKEEKIQECRHPKTKKKSKLTEEQKKNANDVWQALQKFQMVNVHNSVIKGVTQSDVTSWVKNFTIQDIRESIKMAYDASGVKSYPAYIQKLLSAKIVQKGKDSDQGRVYVQSIIKKYELKHIELKKDYFVDIISGDQMFYYLPQHTLESFLSRSIQRAQENDECHYD